jgi:hypothetical protein
MEKALLYYDNQDLPPSWDHDELLGTDDDEDFNDEEVYINIHLHAFVHCFFFFCFSNLLILLDVIKIDDMTFTYLYELSVTIVLNHFTGVES